VEKKLELLTDYLGFKNEGVVYTSVEFEKKSDIDGLNSRTPTSFDFYFETELEKKFFFEIKYTESGFGSIKGDNYKHVDKFNKVYKPYLDKNEEKTVIQPEYSEMKEFFKHYQIIRNLIHVNDNSYVVFLYPDGNALIKNSAKEAKEKIIKQECSEHLINVTWEDITSFMISDIKPETDQEKYLFEYLAEFQEKYLNYSKG
jgi:hypothetical protein